MSRDFGHTRNSYSGPPSICTPFRCAVSLTKMGLWWVICSPSESQAMATHETRFQVVKGISFRESYKRYFRGREWFLAWGFITCIVDAGEVCVHSEEFVRAWHANRLRIEEERRVKQKHNGVSIELCMYNVRILVPVIDIDPHLRRNVSKGSTVQPETCCLPFGKYLIPLEYFLLSMYCIFSPAARIF